MATETIQFKVSGLMCSFCTMSVEKALKRYPGVDSVMVNLVHGVVLVEADTARTSRDALADAIQALGYDVAATEAQQYATDTALFGVIRRRGFIGMGSGRDRSAGRPAESFRPARSDTDLVQPSHRRGGAGVGGLPDSS